jgi:hypothetical protein
MNGERERSYRFGLCFLLFKTGLAGQARGRKKRPRVVRRDADSIFRPDASTGPAWKFVRVGFLSPLD